MNVGRVLKQVWFAPVAVLLLSLAAHAVYTLPGGPNSRTAQPRSLTWDEGTVLYDSLRMANGEVLYRDFFEFQGPVFFELFAALFRWFGASLPAAQGLQVLLNALSAMFLCIVVARLAGPLVAFAASVIFITLIVPIWPYAYPHWVALLFVHAALALLPNERPVWWRTALAGACFGLSIATIQSLGVAALASCAVTLVASSVAERRWRAGSSAALQLIGGAATVILAFAASAASKGALRDLWWSMFEWTFAHYRGINSTTYAAFLVDHLDSNRAQPHVWRIFSQAGIVVIAALPLVALLSGVAVLGKAAWAALRKQPQQRIEAAAVAVAVVLPLFVAHTRSDVVHLGFLSSLGFVGLAAACAHWASLRRPTAIILCVLAGAFTLNFSWKTYRSQTHPERPLTFKQDWLQRFSWASDFEAHVTAGDAAVIGFEGSAGYGHLFTNTKSAISYTYLPFDWRAESDYFSAAQWDRAAREIVERRPKVLAVDDEEFARLVRSAPVLATMYEQQVALRLLRPTP